MRHQWPVWFAPLVGLLPVFPADGAIARERSSAVPAAAQPLLLYSAVTAEGADQVPTVETVRADGTGRRRLAIGSAPAWSPDGKRVAYRTFDSVFVMKADGTAKVRIARAAATADVPSWSPNGRRLAFLIGTRDPNGERTNLAVAAAVGARAVRVIGNASDPGWSPDGSRLAYVTSLVAPAEERLVVEAADGATATVIETTREIIEAPRWSRDGTRIAYVLRPRNPHDPAVVPPAEEKLMVEAADGANATVVVTNREIIEAPLWSPDGTRIAYVLRPRNPNHLPTLWIVPSTGGEPRRLGDVGAEAPQWSPDGSTIVFMRGGARGGCGYKVGCDLEGRPCADTCEQLAGLYSIRRDGRSQRRLTRAVDSAPRWSTDRTRLAFIRSYEDRTRGPIDALYQARPGGGCQTAVALGTENRMFDASASWQPQRQGARLPVLHCSDTAVTGTISGSALLGGKLTLGFAIRNVGDRPARNVHFRLDLSHFSLLAPHRGCRDRIVRTYAVRRIVDCRLGTIPAGRTMRLDLHGRLDPKAEALFPGYVERSSARIEAFASVRAAAEADPSNNDLRLVHRFVPCTLEGTSASDLLRGSHGRDLICAREGDDVVRSGAGNDVVDGGVGADVMNPGRGRDVVVGRGGDDDVAVADGERDLVLCGNGHDRVVADLMDEINRSCESVRTTR